MEKLDEVLSLLRTAAPMLQEFITWKQQEAEKERQQEIERSESEKEFEKWLSQRKAEQAQQEAETEELAKHFYGGEKWETEHLAPSYY